MSRLVHIDAGGAARPLSTAVLPEAEGPWVILPTVLAPHVEARSAEPIIAGYNPLTRMAFLKGAVKLAEDGYTYAAGFKPVAVDYSAIPADDKAKFTMHSGLSLAIVDTDATPSDRVIVLAILRPSGYVEMHPVQGLATAALPKGVYYFNIYANMAF